MARKVNKKQKQNNARNWINQILDFATKIKDQTLRNRYAFLVKKISMKSNLKLEPEQKIRFCKHCGEYFKFGDNANIRLRKGRTIIFCKNCKKYTRRPYKK